MKRTRRIPCALIAAALLTSPLLAANGRAADLSGWRETPFPRVHIDDLFWSPRIETVQTVTIPDLLAIAEDQGKIDNLRIIAGRKKDGRIRVYNSPDSDLWKIMEAASYALTWRADPGLDRSLDELIELYAAAQDGDGYINQMFMLSDDHPQSPENAAKARLGYGSDQRFQGTIDQWPRGIGQLYSAGHLFEAAAAHFRATGKRSFLEIAVRMADHCVSRFPPGQPIDYADHPQAGIGLIKLYEVTGDARYLDLADRIVHRGHHGRPPDLGDCESWKPIEQQRKAWGHAVRIHYLYSAATDLCRHLGQPDTRTALDSLWHSIVDRRLYVTGGVGGPAPHEQLADDWVLDNAGCYCECCANIAHGQWNHRLNLLYGDARFADLVELEAYNAALAGISLDGTKYFYRNPLEAGRKGRGGAHGGVRARYLFCCPSKLPGFVAGIGRWGYAIDDRGPIVNLYLGGTADIDLRQTRLRVRQETQYPWEGKIRLTLDPESPIRFDLRLRIPGWARGKPVPSDLYRFGPLPAEETASPTCTVNGKRRDIDLLGLEKGYLSVSRDWKKGDLVELDLPMPMRRVYAHEDVIFDRGRVALMRGPVVYCAEEADHESGVFDLVLPQGAALRAEHWPDLLGGVTVIRGEALVGGKTAAAFTAVPYYAWQHRGIGEMAVWLAENPSVLSAASPNGPMKETDLGNLATLGTIAASCDMVRENTLHALRDGNIPEKSGDTSQSRLAWWPRKGSTESAQCVWEQEQTVEKVKVYWFADHPRGGCKLPAAWRLLFLDGTAWKPVLDAGAYGIRPDRFNEVKFGPVRTRGLRIEVKLQDGFSGGIHEWVIPTVQNTDG